jgi:hypothetical protein
MDKPLACIVAEKRRFFNLDGMGSCSSIDAQAADECLSYGTPPQRTTRRHTAFYRERGGIMRTLSSAAVLVTIMAGDTFVFSGECCTADDSYGTKLAVESTSWGGIMSLYQQACGRPGAIRGGAASRRRRLSALRGAPRQRIPRIPARTEIGNALIFSTLSREIVTE